MGADSDGCTDLAQMHWYCSRIQGKEKGCCRVQSTHRALLQNTASTKSLETLQVLQLMESQIMHGTPPEKPYPTSKAAPSIAPSPIPQCKFKSFITAHDAFRADPTLHFQTHEIPSPQIPGMPKNTRLPQATPQRITASQPRAVPNFAQRPHCTVQGIPRKHQAPATH